MGESNNLQSQFTFGKRGGKKGKALKGKKEKIPGKRVLDRKHCHLAGKKLN